MAFKKKLVEECIEKNDVEMTYGCGKGIGLGTGNCRLINSRRGCPQGNPNTWVYVTRMRTGSYT